MKPLGPEDFGHRDTVTSLARDDRQARVLDWAKRCFGERTATDRRERARRLLEEALELAQAESVTLYEATSLAKYVFNRPPGNVLQEIGGVSITLLAMGAALNMSVDTCERLELKRILELTPEHFRKRHAAKAVAGVAMPNSTHDGECQDESGKPVAG